MILVFEFAYEIPNFSSQNECFQDYEISYSKLGNNLAQKFGKRQYGLGSIQVSSSNVWENSIFRLGFS